MIYNITIEETVAEMFEIEANSIEEARDIITKRYFDCEYVLEPGDLVSTKIYMEDYGKVVLDEYIYPKHLRK